MHAAAMTLGKKRKFSITMKHCVAVGYGQCHTGGGDGATFVCKYNDKIDNFESDCENDSGCNCKAL